MGQQNIQWAWGYSQHYIGKVFKVSQSLINKVLLNKTRRELA